MLLLKMGSPSGMHSPFGELVVLACEVGGRWGDAATKYVAQLVRQRVRSAPALMRSSAGAAWRSRWWGLLSIAAQDALAASLLREGHRALGGAAGHDEPCLADVLGGVRAISLGLRGV